MKTICPHEVDKSCPERRGCSHATPHDHASSPLFGCDSLCGPYGRVVCIPFKEKPMEPKKRKSPTIYYRCEAAMRGLCAERNAMTPGLGGDPMTLCVSYPLHPKTHNSGCEPMKCLNVNSPMYGQTVHCIKAPKRPRPERKQLYSCWSSFSCMVMSCPHRTEHRHASTCNNVACAHAPVGISGACTPSKG